MQESSKEISEAEKIEKARKAKAAYEKTQLRTRENRCLNYLWSLPAEERENLRRMPYRELIDYLDSKRPKIVTKTHEELFKELFKEYIFQTELSKFGRAGAHFQKEYFRILKPQYLEACIKGIREKWCKETVNFLKYDSTQQFLKAKTLGKKTSKVKKSLPPRIFWTPQQLDEIIQLLLTNE